MGGERGGSVKTATKLGKVVVSCAKVNSPSLAARSSGGLRDTTGAAGDRPGTFSR